MPQESNARCSILSFFSRGKQDHKLTLHRSNTRNSRGEFSKFKDCLETSFFLYFCDGNINYELCKGFALKLGHFGKQIRNTGKVLKSGSGEGWRRSLGLILWEMKRWHKHLREGISYKQ